MSIPKMNHLQLNLLLKCLLIVVSELGSPSPPECHNPNLSHHRCIDMNIADNDNSVSFIQRTTDMITSGDETVKYHNIYSQQVAPM